MAKLKVKAKRVPEEVPENEPRELNPNDWELDMDDLPEERITEPYDAEAQNEAFDATFKGKKSSYPTHKKAWFWLVVLLAVLAFGALYFHNERVNQLENVTATTATTAVEVSTTEPVKEEMLIEAKDFVVPAGVSLVKGPQGWGLYDYYDRLQRSYVGIASNDHGTWFVNNGLADFSYTGLVKVGNTTYHVEKGKVDVTAPVSTESDDTSTSVSTSAASAADVGTPKQQEAAKGAKEYLSVATSSKKWLIAQLQTDGFSYDDAVWGAEHCGADWNEQAYLKAKEYLELTTFNHEDLVTQLIFEGFTNEEAETGVTRAGL